MSGLAAVSQTCFRSAAPPPVLILTPLQEAPAGVGGEADAGWGAGPARDARYFREYEVRQSQKRLRIRQDIYVREERGHEGRPTDASPRICRIEMTLLPTGDDTPNLASKA